VTNRPAPLKQICVDALHARRIADSLDALPDCRAEALKWRHIADSTQAKANDYLAASERNLDAKRAAENVANQQQSIAISNGQKYAEAHRKANRRTVIIVLLLVWNVLTGTYIVTH